MQWFTSPTVRSRSLAGWWMVHYHAWDVQGHTDGGYLQVPRLVDDKSPLKQSYVATVISASLISSRRSIGLRMVLLS